MRGGAQENGDTDQETITGRMEEMDVDGKMTHPLTTTIDQQIPGVEVEVEGESPQMDHGTGMEAMVTE